ncbi:MAG: NUDIX hydrolase [Acidobacteria bacterium]|nr:NUDIX hydrolase [Acidobacteriota bacterium]
MTSKRPRILEWAREIQALAQIGHHYACDNYQRERCRRLMEIAAEMVSENSDLERLSLMRSYQSQAGYATPKVDVRAAVFQGGRLLLVRERIDGGWTMPGGWVDVGDSPAAAVERETFEEAGFRVKARKVIGIYDSNRLDPLELYHAFKIVFLCDLIDGEARPSHETSDVGFFGPDEIPGVLSGERTTPRHIRDAFASLATPQLPTVFD